MKSLVLGIFILCIVLIVRCQDIKDNPIITDVIIMADDRMTFPVEYPEQKPSDPDDVKVPKKKPINQPFDPKDKGINLNYGTNICQSLKHFAIRFGSNADATQKYLTYPLVCGSSNLNILPATGPSNRPGNDQLFFAYQLSDKTWLLESKSCPFYFIRATSLTTIKLELGPYMSSKFWIQYHQNHIHIKSNFYFGNYWAGGLPLVLSVGATSYMVEFWP